MKKTLTILLLVTIILCTCSCKTSSHRKLEFEDGESYCFDGACAVNEDYIAFGGVTILSDPKREYVSINGRKFTITFCDCENKNK